MTLLLLVITTSQATISSLGTNIVDFSSELTAYTPQSGRTGKFVSFNNLSGNIQKKVNTNKTEDKYVNNSMFYGISDAAGGDGKYSNKLNFSSKTSIKDYRQPY